MEGAFQINQPTSKLRNCVNAALNLSTEGDGQNWSSVSQPVGHVQEQQQKAGGCQVLQLPGSEEAAGGGARSGGAVQRYCCYAGTSFPCHLDSSFQDRN